MYRAFGHSEKTLLKEFISCRERLPSLRSPSAHFRRSFPWQASGHQRQSWFVAPLVPLHRYDLPLDHLSRWPTHHLCWNSHSTGQCSSTRVSQRAVLQLEPCQCDHVVHCSLVPEIESRDRIQRRSWTSWGRWPVHDIAKKPCINMGVSVPWEMADIRSLDWCCACRRWCWNRPCSRYRGSEVGC